MTAEERGRARSQKRRRALPRARARGAAETPSDRPARTFAAGSLRPLPFVAGLAWLCLVLASSAFAPAAGAAGCANEALRVGASANLPDCRAYEQATPVDKNGNNVQLSPNYVEAAAGGSRISFLVSGGVPGGVSSTDLPTYVSSRGADSWKTVGLLPPAATGPRGFVLGWDTELAHAYSLNFHLEAPIVPTIYGLDLPADEFETVAAGRSPQAAFVGSSRDGRFTAFEDLFGEQSVYVFDKNTGDVTTASVLNDGSFVEGAVAGPYNWVEEGALGGANGRFFTAAQNVLSEDGSTIYFTEPFEPNQLYVRRNIQAPQSPLNGSGECTDPLGACTTKVSATQTSVPDPNGERAAAFMGASPDGAKALFLSAGKLTDDATTGPFDEGSDLYLFDADSGGLIDISVDGADPAGAEVVGVLGYADDMSYVYFAANGVLAPGATAGNCRRETPTQLRECNLYVWHRGPGGEEVSYIGPMQTGNAEAGRTDEVNWKPRTIAGTPHNPSPSGQVSADGKVLLFSSVLDQTAAQSNGYSQLYFYAADSGTVSCLSCSPTGGAPSGDASVNAAPPPQNTPRSKAGVRLRNLAKDGERVFFDSPDQLLPADINEVNDVYEWEEQGSGSCDSTAPSGGCLYLISSGESRTASYFADADEEGDNVFFATAQSLVGQDRDELIDIYDARVDGGMASQSAEPPAWCASSAECSPSATATGAIGTVGTAVFQGPPNPKQKPKHHKKKHHKKRSTKAKNQKGHR